MPLSGCPSVGPHITKNHRRVSCRFILRIIDYSLQSLLNSYIRFESNDTCWLQATLPCESEWTWHLEYNALTATLASADGPSNLVVHFRAPISTHSITAARATICHLLLPRLHIGEGHWSSHQMTFWGPKASACRFRGTSQEGIGSGGHLDTVPVLLTRRCKKQGVCTLSW